VIKRAVYRTAALLAVCLLVAALLMDKWAPTAKEWAEGESRNSEGDSPIFAARKSGQSPNGPHKLRIVSLSPSVTEMLFAVGAGDAIVGVTDHSDYPPEARQIECIGGFGTPSMEKLLALAPDLVIGTGVERAGVTDVLSRAGTRVLWVKTGNFAELFDALVEIGRQVGRRRQAEEIVAAMEAKLEAIAERFRSIPLEKRPRVFVEIWSDPITTAGNGSFVDEIITRAGGVNVAHQIDSAYPTVNPEKVVEWNPDVILLGYMNQEPSKEVLAGRIGWAGVAAVRSGSVIRDVSSDLLLRPGPRLVEGVDILNRRLYGVAPDQRARR
jgi:iron complex transport system substrate-binding protein